MKKLISAVLCLAMIFTVVSCSTDPEVKKKERSDVEDEDREEDDDSDKEDKDKNDDTPKTTASTTDAVDPSESEDQAPTPKPATPTPALADDELSGEFKTTAKVGKVSVDVGPYVMEGDGKLEVKPREAEVSEDGDYKIESYEITIGDLHDLGDFITIRIPYDESFCEKGQDPAKCVGAKYFNQEEGVWEGVPFEVDTKAKELVITTDHLSVYGAIHIKNEGMRKAMITRDDDIDFDDISGLDTIFDNVISEESMDSITLQTAGAYVASGIFEGVDAYSNIQDFTDAGLKIYTLGESGFSDLFKKEAAPKLEALGYCVLGLKAIKAASTGDKADILGLYKDVMLKMVDVGGGALTAAGSAAFALSLTGVWVFDKVINAMFEEGQNIKMENMGAIYQYYNDSFSEGAHKPRTNKEWRQIMIDAIEKNPDEPEKAEKMIRDSIDAYCNEFWNIDDDVMWACTDSAGYKRMPWPTAAEKKKITDDYKKNLMERLHPVRTSVRNYFVNKANAQYAAALDKVIAFYNQPITLIARDGITDTNDKKAESPYVDYLWALGPLNDTAKKEDWGGFKIGKVGNVKVQFTLIGYALAGAPTEFRVFKPDADVNTDKPEIAVKFKVDKKKIELKYGGLTLEELLGTYQGDVNILKLALTDSAYEDYLAEQSEDDEDDLTSGSEPMSRDECDLALTSLIQDGTLAFKDIVTITSDDPKSNRCEVTFTLVSKSDGEEGEAKETPIPCPCIFDKGVLKFDAPNGEASGTITPKKEGKEITLSASKISLGLKEDAESGGEDAKGAVAVTIDASMNVKKQG